MISEKIVITGGPGTGKTSIINSLEAEGFFCFHEIIRTMTLAAKKDAKAGSLTSNPLTFSQDPALFNKNLLEGRLQHYKDAKDRKESTLFFDRGVPDVLAYMDFFKQDYNQYFLDTCQNNRYSKIFILPPWKEIYVSDNERLESFDEAVAIHQHLEKTYTSFGYELHSVPTGTIKERVAFIKDNISI